jgi:hypothetical protein
MKNDDPSGIGKTSSTPGLACAPYDPPVRSFQAELR